MRMKKRLAAILLALTLALSLLPVSALADEAGKGGATSGTRVDGVEGSEKNPDGEGGGDITPPMTSCPGDSSCTYTGTDHKEGCPKYTPPVMTECSGDNSCTYTGTDHKEGCPKYTPPVMTECSGDDSCTYTGTNHKKGCPKYTPPVMTECSGNDSCTYAGTDHKEGCPKYKAPAEPTTMITLTTPSLNAAQGTANNISVSWGSVGSVPSVSGLTNAAALNKITVSIKVGSSSTISKNVSAGSSSVSFDNITLAAADAGKTSVNVSVKATFEAKTAFTIGSTSYGVSSNTTVLEAMASCAFKPVASADPASATEKSGKPQSIRYDPSTGALSWSINPTYKDNAKPGSGTKIDQFYNEHWILTLKRGSTVIEKDIHFDTAPGSGELKVTRKQNAFSATYKPGKTLEPGTYTIELLNERSMGSGENFTGTCSFTVSDGKTPTDVKSALEKLLDEGFTSSSTAKAARDTILNTLSGSSSSRLASLAKSLQEDTSAARDLVRLVDRVEDKFLDAKDITVSRVSDKKLDTAISSVTGLGLNDASGRKITIEAAPTKSGYDTPSGARASAAVALTVSGLSDNRNMTFPVQLAMKLPGGFNSSDKVYVLHYKTSGKDPEKLDAYIRDEKIIFTTTSFSDFLLVQENAAGYKVNVSLSTNGTVTADKKESAKGGTVTLTIKPDTGYALAALVISSKDGKTVGATKQSDTQYTFTMPEADVTVQAVFMTAQIAGFTDVPSTHTFYKEISWTAQKGVMNGVGGGKFNPNGKVTRQQMWMVLGRMAGANPANMAAARAWAIDNGISDGSKPTGAVSRQQLVTMLYRYAMNRNLAVGGAANISTYPDNGAVSNYAKDALAWAVGNGIVAGTSSGKLNPQGTATRAHFAAFVYRFNQKTGA